VSVGQPDQRPDCTTKRRRCGAAATAIAAAGTGRECLFDPMTACWRIVQSSVAWSATSCPTAQSPEASLRMRGRRQQRGPAAAATLRQRLRGSAKC
jgi:hypothetical protein